MSSEELVLELQTREVIGKGLGAFKRSGNVPAVIHRPGKDSLVVSGLFTEVSKVYSLAGKHHPVTVKIGKESYLTIIKNADFEPKKHMLRHVVFGTIKQNEKVETEVPIHFEGDAPAEKKGLIVIKQLDHVKLEAFPRNLPDSVTVSVEQLEDIGDKITVADIDVQEGVAILTDVEHSIAVVEETPAQVSEEAEADTEEQAEGSEEATPGEAEEK